MQFPPAARTTGQAFSNRKRSSAIAIAYYNEIDPFAAQWLRELIDAGHIAPGQVDERSIEDVTPEDIRGFTQCHFFAGIGVWSYALRQADWPDDKPIWTGSCPCQPFSKTGTGKGFADPRHLWPSFHWLISQCQPDLVIGEQVAGKAGESWLDLVSTDLEAADYACGAVTFPACSVGAPHQRQRLYWMADAQSAGCQFRETRRSRTGNEPNPRRRYAEPDSSSASGYVAHGSVSSIGSPGPTNGHWSDVDWLLCRDERWRPVEPGSFPLVDGSPARVGRLRGYGNAIVAEQAKIFIETVRELLTGNRL